MDIPSSETWGEAFGFRLCGNKQIMRAWSFSECHWGPAVPHQVRAAVAPAAWGAAELLRLTHLSARQRIASAELLLLPDIPSLP